MNENLASSSCFYLVLCSYTYTSIQPARYLRQETSRRLAYTFSWIYSSLASITKPGHRGERGERGTSIIHTILFRNAIATCGHMIVTWHNNIGGTSADLPSCTDIPQWSHSTISPPSVLGKRERERERERETKILQYPDPLWKLKNLIITLIYM